MAIFQKLICLIGSCKIYFFVFSLKILVSSSSDLPSKKEIEEIRKPELTKDFFAALPYTSPDVLLIESGSFYIEQCTPIGEVKKTIVNPVYRWYGPNFKKEVSGHHFIKLKNGNLVFTRPTPKETGTYFCRMSSSDIDEYFEEHVRSVVIFTPPMWIKEMFLYFLVPNCDKRIIEEIINLTKSLLCSKDSNCLYQVKIDECSSLTEFLEMMQVKVCIHQYLRDSFVTNLPANCGIECVNNHSVQELERFSSSTASELRRHMKMAHREMTQSLLEDTKTTIKVRPICVEGYELYKEKVCIPCDVGKARKFDVDKQKCQSCDLSSYSSVLGNSQCTYCPLFKIVSHYGATSMDECIWFYYSTYALLLIFPALVLFSLVVGIIISFFFDSNTESRHKMWKIIYDCCCYEGDDRRFKELAKKNSKLMKKIKSHKNISKYYL